MKNEGEKDVSSVLSIEIHLFSREQVPRNSPKIKKNDSIDMNHKVRITLLLDNPSS